MLHDRVYNFSAGPSVLPEPVLEQARQSLFNYAGTGMSVMEMSHRSPAFDAIFQDAKARLRAVMKIPDDYDILFLQGGATLQFSMVPMNLIGRTGHCDYAVTGSFAKKAWEEARRFGDARAAVDGKAQQYTRIPRIEELQIGADSAYFHYCANNTIYGTEWDYVPAFGDLPIVCDMSSNILSRPVDVRRYGLIYAGAQKNMAPAGLTVVILKKGLVEEPLPYTPLMLRYDTHQKADSMHNTPPCWCIYILGLVLAWVQDEGGVEEMERRSRERSRLLYDYIEESKLFRCAVEPGSRSRMNVTFRTGDEALDAQFVKAAKEHGFVNLKGHRLVGGMRASIYNAQPVEGVRALRDFMARFEKENV